MNAYDFNLTKAIQFGDIVILSNCRDASMCIKRGITGNSHMTSNLNKICLCWPVFCAKLTVLP